MSLQPINGIFINILYIYTDTHSLRRTRSLFLLLYNLPASLLTVPFRRSRRHPCSFLLPDSRCTTSCRILVGCSHAPMLIFCQFPCCLASPVPSRFSSSLSCFLLFHFMLMSFHLFHQWGMLSWKECHILVSLLHYYIKPHFRANYHLRTTGSSFSRGFVSSAYEVLCAQWDI